MFSKLFKRKVQESDFLKPRRIPRAPRVHVVEGHECYFTSAESKTFSVLNISESGIGFSCDAVLEKLLTGKLTIYGQELKLRLEVVQWQKGILGCKVSAEQSEFGVIIRKNFSKEIAVSKMSEVSSAHLRVEPGEEARWFFDSDNELFYASKNNEVLRADMLVNGEFFRCEQGKKSKVGSISNQEKQKQEYAKTDTIAWNDGISDAEKRLFSRLIQNVPNLDKNHLQQIITLFFKT